MRRTTLIGVLMVLLVAGLAALQLKFTGSMAPLKEGEPKAAANLVILNAQEIYQKAVKEAVDMSSGPCLADDEIPDWVVDVAHNPRQPVDDLPENQCPSYLSGKAKHFVELDPAGNVIRAE